MARGRPRLKAEEYQERMTAYCARYGVVATAEGLPPFPAGRRETPQHKAWMALYKAHRRLSAPAGPDPFSERRRRELLTAQRGRCPICGRGVVATDRLDPAGAAPRALLHEACAQAVSLARRGGAEVLDRIRAHVWLHGPDSPSPPLEKGGEAAPAPRRRGIRS